MRTVAVTKPISHETLVKLRDLLAESHEVLDKAVEIVPQRGQLWCFDVQSLDRLIPTLETIKNRINESQRAMRSGYPLTEHQAKPRSVVAKAPRRSIEEETKDMVKRGIENAKGAKKGPGKPPSKKGARKKSG